MRGFPCADMDLDVAIAALEHRPGAYVLLGSDGKYLYKGACRDLCERLKDYLSRFQTGR